MNFPARLPNSSYPLTALFVLTCQKARLDRQAGFSCSGSGELWERFALMNLPSWKPDPQLTPNPSLTDGCFLIFRPLKWSTSAATPVFASPLNNSPEAFFQETLSRRWQSGANFPMMDNVCVPEGGLWAAIRIDLDLAILLSSEWRGYDG
jgi:hypothetical protein